MHKACDCDCAQEFEHYQNPLKNVSEFVQCVIKRTEEVPDCSVSDFFKVDAAQKHGALVIGGASLVSGAGTRLQKIMLLRTLCLDAISKNIVETLLSPLNCLSSNHQSSPSGINLLRKNSQVSALLRAEGNQYYQKKKFTTALRCYTYAAAYAPPKSSLEALSYSNRSACFFERKNYEKCLEDIDQFLALDTTQLGSKVVDRVKNRKIKCLQQLENGKSRPHSSEKTSILNLFKLSCPSKTISGAESFVKIRENGSKGNFLVNGGKTTILPGTLVMLEEPYAQVFKGSLGFHGKNCSACLKHLNRGGIPCEECVFVLYCSKECATSAFHEHHLKYECKISPLLYERHLSEHLYLALTMALKVTPEELLSERRKRSKSSSSRKKKSSSPSHWETFSGLQFDEKDLPHDLLLFFYLDSILLTEMVDSGTEYFWSWNSSNLEQGRVKEKFAELILYYMIGLHFNAEIHKEVTRNYFIDFVPNFETFNVFEKIGLAYFPLLAKANHSCDPNIISVTLPKGIKATIAIQHIIPGQELLTCYDDCNFALYDRNERKSVLAERFNFSCNCPPCKLNWLSNLQSELLFNHLIELTQLHACPTCRLTVDFADTEKIAELSSTSLQVEDNLLACPKCKWSVPVDRALEEKKKWCEMLLQDSSRVKRSAEEFVKYYEKVVACRRYFDANIMRPSLYYSMSMLQITTEVATVAAQLFD